MSCLTKQSFSASKQVHKLPMREHGEGAYINVLEIGAKDLVELRKSHETNTSDTKHMDFLHELLSRSLVDDEGRRIFADAADVAANFNLSFRHLEHLANEVLSLSGIVAPKN